MRSHLRVDYVENKSHICNGDMGFELTNASFSFKTLAERPVNSCHSRKLRALASHLHKMYPKLIQMPASFSHCPVISCILTNSKKSGLSVGIDVEEKNRKIPKSIINRFSNERDNFKNSTHIAIWTLREACFKALDNFSGKIDPAEISIDVDNDWFFYKQRKVGSFFLIDGPLNTQIAIAETCSRMAMSPHNH